MSCRPHLPKTGNLLQALASQMPASLQTGPGAHKLCKHGQAGHPSRRAHNIRLSSGCSSLRPGQPCPLANICMFKLRPALALPRNFQSIAKYLRAKSGTINSAIVRHIGTARCTHSHRDCEVLIVRIRHAPKSTNSYRAQCFEPIGPQPLLAPEPKLLQEVATDHDDGESVGWRQ